MSLFCLNKVVTRKIYFMPNKKEFALEKLNALKERLLDLTARNRMINSKFSAYGKKHFRIIDEIPQQIYEKLSSSMTFQPLPPLKDEPKDEKKKIFKEKLSLAKHTDQEYIDGLETIIDLEEEKNLLRQLKNKVREDLGMKPFLGKNTPIKDHAKSNNINPSYELLDFSIEEEKKHQDTKIQTLFLQDQLNSYVNNIWKDFRSSQKETGVNPLYFCFGFLEWKASTDADNNFYSPLLMLQVQLDETSKGAALKVSATGDDLMVNLSLKEKLKKEFKLDLPSLPILEEEDKYHSIVEYFKKVEKLASEQNWSLKKWVSFGIYNAQEMPIYQDLENIENLGLNDLLKTLLVGQESNNDQGQFAEIYDVDSKESQKKIPALVTDADSSQFSAILDAINGNNIVLKGPPGTGKSQTITNIIASLCSSGKKVLFVAQKQAALDVVRNNLEAIGSEDYLLEIFSMKANKKAVMESIRKRNEKPNPQEASSLKNDIKFLNEIKSDLNKYANFINSKYESSDKTIHEILWDQIDIEDLNLPLLENIKISSPQKISDLSLEKIDRELESPKTFIQENFQDLNIHLSALGRINKIIYDSETINKTSEKTLAVCSKFLVHFNYLKDLQSHHKELFDIPIKDILENPFISSWIASKDETDNRLTSLLLKLENFDSMEQFLKDKTEHDKKVKVLENQQRFIAKTFSYDQEESVYSLQDIKNSAKKLMDTSIFSYFQSEWWTSRKMFINISKLPKHLRASGLESGKHLEELYKYHKTESTSQERINDLRIILDTQISKFLNLNPEADEELIYIKRHLLSQAIQDLETFDRAFIEFWSSNEDLFKKYCKTLLQFLSEYNSLKTLLSDLEYEVQRPEGQPKLCEFYELSEILQDLVDNLSYLPDYLSLKVLEEGLEDKNIRNFYEIYTKSGADIENINLVFKHYVRKAQKQHIEKNNSKEFKEYNGVKIEILRKQLSDLDLKVSKNYQKEVSKSIYSYGEKAPAGTSSGPVGEKRQMGLVNHLSRVSSPKMSIREFINNTDKALLALKPCTLMSPLTVSSTLPLKQVFDVVVIDEASQMKPEYALGAIARAKQAIIVGDPNQLPPTTFYRATSAYDEFDDDLSNESILDMALTVFHPPRELLWHYRSRHEDLIKFSNAKFYQNLLIPVTADKTKKDRGISYNYLNEGMYLSGSGAGSGGVNPNEAISVVDAAVKFMHERPEESLGIATMNIKQKDLIQSEFDLRKSRDPKILEYLNIWEEKNVGLEEFFVKNLENVQGDERDVIIISTVYGRNQDGNMHQRFGPINGKYGARRLNVLFSRAKNQIQLFTSLKASDIRADEASALGLQVFKDYLTFAETGILQEAEQNVHEVESGFQQWAIDVINSFPGYSATHEIGAQGYRIDIGVKHEDFPHGFIMAVETDGAAYHSSSSARDRDKLRQGVLEDHGWVFHRIWSTDWTNNPVRVKKRLKDALDDRLKEVIKELEKRNEELALVSTDQESNEITPNKFLPGTNLNTYPYIPIQLEEFMHVKQERFYDRSYESTLTNGVINIIDTEGPVSFEVIVQRVKDAHDFNKAGSKIRNIIAKVIPQEYRSTTYKFEGVERRFYWPKEFDPKEWKAGRYPLTDDEDSYRDLYDVCPQEILAIARQIEGGGNLAKEISSFLGFNRCTENMESYINRICSN